MTQGRGRGTIKFGGVTLELFTNLFSLSNKGMAQTELGGWWIHSKPHEC